MAIFTTTPDMTPEEAVEAMQAESDATYLAARNAEMSVKVREASWNLVRLGLIFFGATAVLAIAKAKTT